VLIASCLAGAQQPPLEEAAGTSGSTGELLKAGPGYQNVITTDLVDDPMLTAGNIKTFKKAFKELYDFAMVRPEYFSACIHCRVAYLNLLLYVECDHTLSEKIRKTESSCEWSPRACCPGKVHLRREDEELLYAEGARHAEIGKDSRDLATQERPAKPRESQLRAPRTTRGAEESAPR
jgi:hypothetical protein